MATTSVLIAILLQGPAATPAPAEIDALLAALQRPLPAATAFVERRESGLLDAPLLLRGELSQPRAHVLVKRITEPYRERTTIEDGRVEIEREGERRRRFSLRNAPALEGLLASFQALLSGDRALLERHYSLALDTGADGWTLRLLPRDARLARRIQAVHLSGRDGELRCMEIREDDGDASRMLLGSAAAAPVPTAEQFAQACRAGTPAP